MKSSHPMLILLGLALCVLPASAQPPLKVAALHPLIANLARDVGGGAVDVWSVLPEGGDPHNFEPSPRDIMRLGSVQIILASGKNLEASLDKFVNQSGNAARVVEVGKTIPSIRVAADSELFVCCPAHSAGSIDPHWWHSVPNWRKAARVVADAFSKALPERAGEYRSNLAALDGRLATLDAWVRSEVRQIPKENRILATAHLSFSYFCQEYGFRVLPVQGLDAESDPSPAYLAETILQIKTNKVRALFPEHLANTRIVKQISAESGAAIGPELIADGTGTGSAATFEGMMRHNAGAITKALR